MIEPSPGDAVEESRRLEALRAMAGDNVERQHVVSKVILKGFTDASRHLHSVSVADPNARVRRVGPGGAGVVPNLVPQASRSAEELWGRTETRIPRVLKLCDRDRLHDDPDAIAVARDIVALHYVRSRSFRIVHERAYRRARANVRRRFPAHPGYERAFLREYGVLPAGDEAAELYFDRLARQHDLDFETGLTFRVSIERLFKRCREWLTKSQVEVVHPASGMFLIGDSPVILRDRFGRMGPLEGVALGNADQVFMPFGPRSLIAFGPDAAVGAVPDNLVEALNTFQVRAAHEYVFMHPDSGLEEFVRRVRFGAEDAASVEL